MLDFLKDSPPYPKKARASGKRVTVVVGTGEQVTHNMAKGESREPFEMMLNMRGNA